MIWNNALIVLILFTYVHIKQFVLLIQQNAIAISLVIC